MIATVNFEILDFKTITQDTTNQYIKNKKIRQLIENIQKQHDREYEFLDKYNPIDHNNIQQLYKACKQHLKKHLKSTEKNHNSLLEIIHHIEQINASLSADCTYYKRKINDSTKISNATKHKLITNIQDGLSRLQI